MIGFKNYHFRYIKFVLYVLIVVSIVALVFVVLFKNILKDDSVPTIENIPTTTVTETPAPANTNRIKIQLAGDIVLNDKFLASNRNAYGEYDFENCFSSIVPSLDGDLVLFNLEGVIDANKNGEGISGAPFYNYPKEIVEAACKAGFNVCITANDRASYFYNDGIKNNVENIRQAGLMVSGSSLEGEKNYIVSEFNGIKVAVLAYTDKFDNYDKIDVSRIASIDFHDVEGTMDRIEEDIASARNEGAEIIIASMHWGEELASKVTDEQKELAERMLKSGVDIIYGTRPHVFQTVTFKQMPDESGERKNVIVAYSMGNFLSQPTVTTGQLTQQSGILNIYVERDTNGKAYISSAQCMPIYIYAKALDSAGTNYSYSVLPATEYALAEERPQVFLNDEDWQNCKTAYEHMKEIVENRPADEILLGLE